MVARLVIASAGSGKTTSIVKEAIQKSKIENVLITTYTDANAEGIRQKLIKEIGCVPSNITVQTWFSFLLQHGVRPYQGSIGINKNMWDCPIVGCLLTDGDSAIIQRGGKTFRKNSKNYSYYLTQDNKIFTDKLSEFAIKCNQNNQVINRLSKIFQYIFIDEVQDFSGYDLDFLALLIESPITLIMVGDPRQSTYRTSNVRYNCQYAGGNMVQFISDKCLDRYVSVDTTSNITNYRCNKNICDFSNMLFLNYPQARALYERYEGYEHQGIFLISSGDVARYISTYNPVQLRWNKGKDVYHNAPVYNLGESKGLEFDRVLIYPTRPFINWLRDHSSNLPDEARAKFYVGLTRAKYSVGIVCDKDIENIERWIP